MNAPANPVEDLEIIDTNLDFSVIQEPLTLPDGTPTEYFANRRTDNGAVLGVVTSQYRPMQNRDLFAFAEDLFKNKGHRFINAGATVLKGGAQVRAKYRFPDLAIRVAGQEHQFQLMVQNSFDGSLKVSFDLGLFRMLCSNGMKIPAFAGSAVSLMKKHTESMSLAFASDAFDFSLKSFNNSVEVYENFVRQRLTQVEGHKVLNGLVTRKAMAERMAESVREIWDKPTHKEDESRNLFNLYNAVTQHLTHEVAPKRFTLSERVSVAVTDELTNAHRKGISSLFVDSLAPRKPRISHKFINN
jgi:hypothetical protein